MTRLFVCWELAEIWKVFRFLSLKVIIAGTLAAASCSAPPAEGPWEVTEYFATTRQVENPISKELDGLYGSSRGDLTYGEIKVSIPPNHKIGHIEKNPFRVIGFKADKSQHFSAINFSLGSELEFMENIGKLSSVDPERSALVYIHGFNVTFEDAAFTTAQFAFDLSFSGVPIFFSWPSKGEMFPWAYTADQDSARAAGPVAREVIEKILSKPELEKVFFFAHSMGTDILTTAIKELVVERPELKQKIRLLVLAAADIDADVFNTQIGPSLVKLGLPTTMYASSNDKAMLASEAIAAFGRVGDIRYAKPIPGIEVVDASNVNTSFFGHGYVNEERTILTDVFYLVHFGVPAEKRSGLAYRSVPGGVIWSFLN